MKDTKLYVSVVTLSARDDQKYQNFLAKDLKDQFIGMNVKQKVKININKCFLKSNFVGVFILFEIDYFFNLFK